MTWKPKKQQVLAPTALEVYWEKYGTWILGAVTVVLAVVLVSMLVRQYTEGKGRRGQSELSAIQLSDPTAKGQLEKLLLEYGGTKLGPQIQLKEAQVMFRAGKREDLEGAEKMLEGLRGDQRLSTVDRAQVTLTLAYTAMELADGAQKRGETEEARRRYDEARKRFEDVEKEELYAAEAKHMLEVLGRMQPVVPPAPVAPAATPAPAPGGGR